MGLAGWAPGEWAWWGAGDGGDWPAAERPPVAPARGTPAGVRGSGGAVSSLDGLESDFSLKSEMFPKQSFLFV